MSVVVHKSVYTWLNVYILMSAVKADIVSTNKPAVQSSGSVDRAGKVVDGSVEGTFADGKCTYITRSEDSLAWWRVNLEALYRVSSVLVYGANEKQDNFDILIGNYTNHQNPKCSSEPVYTPPYTNVSCSAVGTYVGYYKTNNDNATLCEVQVIGTKVEGCNPGHFGTNCCSGHCKDDSCDNDGSCTDGCFQDIDGAMWIGNECNVEIPIMGFDAADNVDKYPAIVTNHSITWRWQEGADISEQAAPYIGYYIYYRLGDTSNWTLGVTVPYTNNEWIKGTVDQLQPNTDYQFDLKAYRKSINGQTDIGAPSFALSARTLPQSSLGCNEGLVGENCCSSYCKQHRCDKNSGVCTFGCTFDDTGTWWVGNRCDIEIPVMQFGSSDTVDTNPVKVTHNSVTWRWKEAVNITHLSAPYVGYQIYYRITGTRGWKLGSDVPYRLREWQQGTKGELQPDTEYEFDLKAVRKTANGEVVIGPTSYVDFAKAELKARTNMTNGCHEDLQGENCCSPHCKNLACTKETGMCTDGCNYDENEEWWIGVNCNKLIPKMQFGSKDFVDRSPLRITPQSVTWRWKEGVNVSEEAVPYVGYRIYFREVGNADKEWKRGVDVAYIQSDWQEGTVSHLQQYTEYEFDIHVYRKDTDGKIHLGSPSYRESGHSTLTASTNVSFPGCHEGLVGENCCSPHCSNLSCTKTTGECTGGCSYDVNKEWWVGDTCNVQLAQMQFGPKDEVDKSPVRITPQSVTWRWKEGVNVPEEAVTYVGYHIIYRQPGSADWRTGVNVSYRETEWQEGTVSRLRSDTHYEFDIKVYRKTTDGKIHIGTTSYKESGHPFLTAKTSASGCAEDLVGENCCRPHCKNKACHKDTGVCTEGCSYNINGEWWIGERCDVKLPQMQFGSSDVVKETPSEVTSWSVTWQWKEGVNVSAEAVKYVGYHIYYRLASNTAWTLGVNVPYRDREWQEGTVGNLQPNTEYLFQLTAYRKLENGTVYFGPASYTGKEYPMSAKTLENPQTPNPTTITTSLDGSVATSSHDGKSTPITTGVTIGVVLAVVIAAVIGFFLIRRHLAAKRALPETSIMNRKTHENIGQSKMNNLAFIQNLPNIDNNENEEAGASLMVTQMKPEGAEYVNTAGGTIIKLCDLKVYVDEMSAENGYKDQFHALNGLKVSDCVEASRPRNKIRNRFQNIKAYDSTRVFLQPETDELDSGYINGNYITGYKLKQKAYIATQAPNGHTTTDIWRMIWQLKANRIVMLTRTIEHNKRLSEQYWPENIGEEKSFGNFTVKTVKKDVFTDYTLCILQVTKGNSTQTVRHLQFLQWPDKSVPENAFPLLSFRRKVRSFDSVSRGPMIVHCSAGIGRTGTFIALDYLLQQAQAEAEIDVVSLVNQLRTERMKMVQTLVQYEFLHTAILEAVTIGNTAIPNEEFQHRLQALIQVDRTGSYPLYDQFMASQGLKPVIPTRNTEGRKKDNLNKNRVTEVIPDDRVRPKVDLAGGKTYVNAVFVDSFRSEHGIIATQMPLPNTVDDFWRLVYQHRCSSIVMLNALDKYDEKCPVYWPDKEEPKKRNGDIDIEYMATYTYGPIVTREFELTRGKPGNTAALTVKQFHLMDWPTTAELPSIKSLFDLIDFVGRSGPASEAAPLLVHCMDGAARSGLFCAANYMLEKMKADEEVDVFLAVRCVSNSRPQFVCTWNQYHFLHQVAQAYISTYGTYQNM